ncbi:NADP-dependent 3-hydroxy acid dehydrogenase YdfG [Flavobacterium piscis]|uniref:NADP-dependent 3-hydroxy acid dehydrogenase YdfG n=2 Tax=Flavobacterium piscis TaxID=1114874 RepID=A0ABU1Y7J8_9FLAO|nr:NADP-dependent 3-hydroxy acid dehydrogenase YdfG [Flavobacterium piscis]
MRVNSDGVFLGMKSVIPSMLKAGQGFIVNISIADLSAMSSYSSHPDVVKLTEHC